MNHSSDLNPQNLHFDEPRLKMSVAGRFLARLVIYCFYVVLAAAAATFLFSDVSNVFWLGVIFALFLLDRLLYLNAARKSLSALRPGHYPQKINLAEYLTPSALNLLEKAAKETLVVGGGFYLRLLKILIGRKDIREGLSRMDVPLNELSEKADDLLKKSLSETPKNSRTDVILKTENLSKAAFALSLSADEKFIEPWALFSSLTASNNQNIGKIFNLFSIEAEDLEKALIFSRFRGSIKWPVRRPQTLAGFAHRPARIRHRIMNRAWTARTTPTLDKYSTDFTDLAREEKTGFLIGHRNEYERMVDILSRPSKPNALLVGEPGSGKETIVSRLAFEIIKDRTPASLFDKRLVALSVGRLISGASAEEISLRMNRVADEIIKAGNIILYIPDIHDLFKTSGAEHLNAADILSPIIANDAFPVIGATYPREFKNAIEPQSGFADSFEIIRIEEITEDEAIRLLTYESVILEKQYNLIVSFGAVKQTVVLAHKYFRQKLLPSSAEDLLKEALANASQRGDKVLQADDVINVAERKINIPLHRTDAEEAEKLLNLENIIHQRLIDQEEAVKAVSRALREYRSGLSRKGGPIAVSLFVGPTGVGKTELSKILAKIQFGSETMMLRFDMSEYQDKQSIFRFIGSPDGKMAGNLTEAVIQKPYSLILLDEFEKAHPDILNLFLQVFDDGRLTDNLGRVVNFTNTIIIATSNAHSDFIKTHLEAHTSMETIAEELKKKLTEYFRPELLNRFSNITVFKSLSPDDVKAIAQLQLRDLALTLEETHGITLVFDETVVGKIAEWGYEPAFGARPLRGVISEKIRGVLAEKILKEEIMKGDSIKAVLENGEIKFAAK